VAKRLHATIGIDATPERAWQVLTGFAASPDWNPFITRASGTARPGERLHLRMRPPGGRGATLRPTVLEADPGRRLRWLANPVDRHPSAAAPPGEAPPLGILNRQLSL
jgi:hypothetical protein